MSSKSLTIAIAVIGALLLISAASCGGHHKTPVQGIGGSAADPAVIT